MRHMLRVNENMNLDVDNAIIEKVECFKYSGITLDSFLMFHDQY